MSSNSILFRVDGNDQIGLGHLKRCWEVIKSLKLMNFEVYIVCEIRSLEFAKQIFNELEPFAIPNDLSIEDDAIKTLFFAKKLSIDIIFLDSYVLNISWEESVKSSGFDLIVFDDRCEIHKADLVINYRPNIVNTEIHKTYPNQKWLLGSRFIPLSINKPPSNKVERRALIHAGGGSLYHQNTDFFSKCMVELSFLEIETSIICSTTDSHRIIDRIVNSHKFNKNLFRKVDFTPNLAEQLSNYQWVIGPTGTILYEALLAGCNCISYSKEDQSDRQTDSWLNLGHAFHLVDQDLSNQCNADDLVHLALNSTRIDTLLKHSKPNSIDGLGPQRISEAIKKIIKNDPIIDDEPLEVSDITRADSSFIWSWLRARNEITVRGYSSNQNPIRKAEHLKWWVNFEREKYVLQRDGLCKAYFWHEQKTDTKGTFFIGGWFPDKNRKMRLLDALQIVDFQLSLAFSIDNDAVWLATIEPQNKISLSISHYFGFKRASQINIERLKKCFPKITDSTIFLEKRLKNEN